MPPEPAMSYLIAWMFEINPLRATGFGLTGISWSDILAWSQLVDRKLQPDEARLIYQMSQEYASQYNASTDKASPPPYVLDIVEHKKSVSDQLKAILDGMVARQRAK